MKIFNYLCHLKEILGAEGFYEVVYMKSNLKNKLEVMSFGFISLQPHFIYTSESLLDIISIVYKIQE